MALPQFDTLLLRTPRPEPSVLSVYLDVDQTIQANFNRGFATRLVDALSHIARTTLDRPERQHLESAIRDVQGFIGSYVPAGRGLVLFLDTADGFFWHGAVDYQVRDLVRWGRELVLQPLIDASDDLQTYGVVLADRASVRLFLVSVSGIEELLHEKLGNGRVRHIKTVGTDHWGSASHIQRKADEQVKFNLKEVVNAARKLVRDNKLERLILAGRPEITAELRGLLPKNMVRTVIATAHLDMHCPRATVLAATRPLAEAYERNTELQGVDRLLTAAAKKEQAVVGLKRSLEALNAGRVWQLLYSGGFVTPGFECADCFALFAARKGFCPQCGGKLMHVPNVVEHAVEHAIRKGAKVEVVGGEASTTLEAAGHIGALLRLKASAAHHG